MWKLKNCQRSASNQKYSLDCSLQELLVPLPCFAWDVLTVPNHFLIFSWFLLRGLTLRWHHQQAAKVLPRMRPMMKMTTTRNWRSIPRASTQNVQSSLHRCLLQVEFHLQLKVPKWRRPEVSIKIWHRLVLVRRCPRLWSNFRSMTHLEEAAALSKNRSLGVLQT